MTERIHLGSLNNEITPKYTHGVNQAHKLVRTVPSHIVYLTASINHPDQLSRL